jgi:hypothetical protein
MLWLLMRPLCSTVGLKLASRNQDDTVGTPHTVHARSSAKTAPPTNFAGVSQPD